MTKKKKTAPKFTPEVLEEAVRKRAQARVVKDYLAALEVHTNHSEERLAKAQNRLDAVTSQLQEARGVTRLSLTQEMIDLQAQIAALSQDDGFDELEAAFIEEIADYAERKKLSYTALRQSGVPAQVLAAGGIPRTRSS